MGRKAGFGACIVLMGSVSLCGARLVRFEKGGTFYSGNGRYEFRVEDLRPRVQRHVAQGKLVLGDEDDVPWHAEQIRGSLVRIHDGTETMIWGTYLPYAPHRVYVTDDGKHVVTAEIDAWDYRERGMQIFGPNGSLIATYPGEFFTQRGKGGQIRWSLHVSSGYETWHEARDTGFTRDQKCLVVALDRGGTVTSRDPATGKMVTFPPLSYVESLLFIDLEAGNLTSPGSEGDPLTQYGMGAVWVDMLSSEDPEERLGGARGLACGLRRSSWMWPGPCDWKAEYDAYALPVLLEHVDDTDIRVRREVLFSIHRIDPKQSMPIAHEYAQSEESDFRRISAQVLLKPWSREGFSLLVGLLQDPDAEIAQAASVRFHNRVFNASPNNGIGIDLLRDHLVENGHPGEEIDGNIGVLIEVADGSVLLGNTGEEGAAARRAARDLAQKLGIEIVGTFTGSGMSDEERTE